VEDLHRLGELLTDFVYQKSDLKRKVEDAVPRFPAKRARATEHSLDFPSYLERVRSYSEPCWCSPALPACTSRLAPAQLARHGWAAVPGEGRTVRCISCRAVLSLVLPPPTARTHRAMLARQEERASAAHAEFCPWSASACPASWAAAPLATPESVTCLTEYSSALPALPRSLMDRLRSSTSALLAALEQQEQQQVEAEVAETAAALAICGWRPGKLEDTLTDCYGVRRIGLWNFVSLQAEQDRLESEKVARQLSGETEDKDEDSPKKKELNNRKYFDPVAEHLMWNPTLLAGEGGAAGWEETAACLLKPQPADAGEPEASSTDPGVALQTVRDLLDRW